MRHLIVIIFNCRLLELVKFDLLGGPCKYKFLSSRGSSYANSWRDQRFVKSDITTNRMNGMNFFVTIPSSCRKIDLYISFRKTGGAKKLFYPHRQHVSVKPPRIKILLSFSLFLRFARLYFQ